MVRGARHIITGAGAAGERRRANGALVKAVDGVFDKREFGTIERRNHKKRPLSTQIGNRPCHASSLVGIACSVIFKHLIIAAKIRGRP